MNHNLNNLFWAGVAFYVMSIVSWYFSSRRTQFVRVFVPANELRDDLRHGLRKRDEAQYRQAMRSVAVVQVLIATVLIGICLLAT